LTNNDMSQTNVQEQLTGPADSIIKVIRPPAGEYAEPIFRLLEHKGSPWTADIKERLEGERLEWSCDYFVIAEIKEKIISNIWFGTSSQNKEIGTLGHVFTRPEHRGRGLCSALMEVACRIFREQGGLAIYLGSGTPVAIRIYERYGFRLYNPPRGESGIFRWVVKNDPDSFDDSYFAPLPVSIRQGHPGDLSLMGALYNCPHPWLIKDFAHQVYREPGFEGQFLQMIEELKQGGCFRVLENSARQVMGAALLIPNKRPYQGHVKILDFLVHPNYFEHAESLVEGILTEAQPHEVIRAYAASGDKDKIAVLKNSGFGGRCRLRNQFRTDQGSADLRIFTWEPSG